MPYLSQSVDLLFLEARHWLDGLPDGAVPGFDLFRFFKAKSDALPADDGEGRAAMGMLAAASLLSFHPSSRSNPFRVMMQIGDASSAAITDFGPADVETLTQIASAVPQLPVRARLADVAWEAGRHCQTPHWQMGVLAACTYYQVAAVQLEDDSDMEARSALQRGLELAWQFRKQAGNTLDELWNLVETTARNVSGTDNPGLLILIADQCIERRHSLASTLAPLLESAAAAHRTAAGPTLFHAELWGRAAKLWAQANDNERADEARIQEAEGYVAHAEAGAANPMFAAHWMKVGLERLRRASADPVRSAAVHERLLELQQATHSQLTQVSQEIDVRALHDHVMQAVSGKTLEEALFGLALLDTLADPGRIRRSVLEQANRYPLSGSMPAELMNSEGATIGRRGSILIGTEEERASALDAATYAQISRFESFLRAEVMIPRAAQAIYNEHHPSEHDLARYVVGHPFVPEGLAVSIVRGLQHGLEGDWLAAGSYLIPRMEALVRHWLRRKGVVTSTVTSDGFQEERLLSQLLALPQAEQTFGPSLLFELKCHLTEEWGFNLRNNYAHGLMSDGEVASRGTISLWWLLWRVLLMPIISTARQAAANVGEQASALNPQS